MCWGGLHILRKKNKESESVHVFVWESMICAPLYGCLPHGQGITTQGGGHLTGRRWQRQTDRDGGVINTLINNYLNNDTRYTGVSGRGTEGQPGSRRRERSSTKKMKRRLFEKAGGKSDREGEVTRQDGRL